MKADVEHKNESEAVVSSAAPSAPFSPFSIGQNVYTCKYDKHNLKVPVN